MCKHRYHSSIVPNLEARMTSQEKARHIEKRQTGMSFVQISADLGILKNTLKETGILQYIRRFTGSVFVVHWTIFSLHPNHDRVHLQLTVLLIIIAQLIKLFPNRSFLALFQ